MRLPVTSPSFQDPPARPNMVHDPQQRKKRRLQMIHRVVPAFLIRSSRSQRTKSRCDSSFETSVAPSLGTFPNEHPPPTPSASYACDGDTPVEIAYVSKPAGETPVQYVIEASSSIGGSPIHSQQRLITLEDPTTGGQYQGSDLSWTFDHTQSLRCPLAGSVPDEFVWVSQRFARTDLVCPGVGSEIYSPPQPPPQVTYDDTKQPFPTPLRLLLAWSHSNPVTWNEGCCQKLISGDSPSGGTNLSVIDPSPSSLGSGTLVTNPFTAEFVPIIRSFMHSPPSLTVARSLRGEAAQELIDIIDEATAVPELDEELRKQCLHLLYKMCKDCKMLPASYGLQQGSLSVDDICYSGGFADVSAGRYLRRRVAVKRLRFWTKNGPDGFFKRFCREIIVWKRLSHPNVLPLLGVSFTLDPYSFCMVSPWMRNGNVMEYTGSNPGANRLKLLSEVAAGVSYLHAIGVTHGDLKGANILVDDGGISVLADFGLATVSIGLNTIPLSASVVSTAGTIPWMSPELLSGNSSPTQQSDSYALGMVVYEVLTGRSPFYHFRGYTILIAIREGKRPGKPINARSLGFSDRLWGLVVQCWDESPSTRPTAEDLLRCLQDISPTWTPPLEYPIPDSPDGEATPDFISWGEQIMAMDAPTSSFFAPLLIVLCAFVLSFH